MGPTPNAAAYTYTTSHQPSAGLTYVDIDHSLAFSYDVGFREQYGRHTGLVHKSESNSLRDDKCSENVLHGIRCSVDGLVVLLVVVVGFLN